MHISKRTDRIYTKQIDKIRDSVEYRQSGIVWQMINEVSRRKSTAKAKLKATNQQEIIKTVETAFRKLTLKPTKSYT